MPKHNGDNPARLFNLPGQTALRRALRRNQTAPEQKLWRALRSQQLGVKFRRKQGIGPYTVDFYCAECRLVIEGDGESHFQADGLAHDLLRDDFLHAKGLLIVRFNNQQIMRELEAVLQTIAATVRLANHKADSQPVN